MTREELEEGRALLTEFRTYEAQAIANGHSPEMLGAEIEGWLLDHAAELLFLAEEARWRSVAEEPPELFATVLVPADENNDHVAAYLSHSGVWCACETESPLMPSEVPTHWRPLPRGPVKR